MDASGVGPIVNDATPYVAAPLSIVTNLADLGDESDPPTSGGSESSSDDTDPSSQSEAEGFNDYSYSCNNDTDVDENQQDDDDEIVRNTAISRPAKRRRKQRAESSAKRNSHRQTMIDFIEQTELPVVLLGRCKVPKLVKDVKDGQKMPPTKKFLYQYINKALQHPESIKICEGWWERNTIRNYGYAMRDYMTFISNQKINGEVVSSANFAIDGIYIVKCMKWLVKELDKKSGRTLGYYRKLRTLKVAVVGMQEIIARYKASQISDEIRREKFFTEVKTVNNLNLVKDYLKIRQKKSIELQARNLEDKDRDNMFFESYLNEQGIQMMKNMWALTGTGAKGAVKGINAANELMMGHHLLFRGDNKRRAELSDTLYSTQDTGRGLIPVLGFQLTHSKTLGPDNRPRCMGVCRHKHVELCLVSSFAFSLWFRFDFKGGAFQDKKPAWLDKRSWYKIKVLFSVSAESKRNQPISPNHESKLIQTCLDSIGFKSRKKTHIGRKGSAQRADSHQVDFAQILRAGQWSHDALTKYYLSPFPFDFIHFSAGFRKDEPYFIHRNVQPPEELYQYIFPWVEDAMNEVAARPDQRLLPLKKRDGVIPKFLQMLQDLRPIIIQDLAVWMINSPDLESVFTKSPITRDANFEKYKSDLKTHLEKGPTFSSILSETDKIYHYSLEVSKALNLMKTDQDYVSSALLSHMELQALSSRNVSDCMARREMQFAREVTRISNCENRQEATNEVVSLLADEIKNLRVTISDLSSHVSLLHSKLDATPPGSSESSSSKRSRTAEICTSIAKKAKLDIDPEDPQFDMIPLAKQSVMDVLSEWSVLSPGRPSIAKRLDDYGKQWVVGTGKYPAFKRKWMVIQFLVKHLPPEMEEFEKNFQVWQLGALFDIYRSTRESTSLPNLIRAIQSTKTRDTVIGEVKEFWGHMAEEDQEKILALEELNGITSENFIELD